MGVVGLTERFDASLLLLQRLCGWAAPDYLSHNVTPNRPCRADLSPAALRAIEKRTVLGRELYDYGAQLFGAQAAARGPEFADDLRRFQERSRRFGVWHVRKAAALRKVRQARRFAFDRLPRARFRPAAPIVSLVCLVCAGAAA